MREMYIPMGQLIDLFFQWYETTEGISRTILSDKSMFVYIKTSVVCERESYLDWDGKEASDGTRNEFTDGVSNVCVKCVFMMRSTKLCT